MGVGDQHTPFARTLQQIQKLCDMRVHRDQVVDLLLQQRDIQAQFAAPVIDAVPIQRTLDVAGAPRTSS